MTRTTRPGRCLRRAIPAGLAVAALLIAGLPAQAETPAEFYKGKTLNVYVGVSAGGIYSNFAMVLVRHMPRHMAGNPTMVVQHMPGAGGSRAVAYIYSVAPKDGTAVVTPNSGVALRVLLGIDKPTYDPSKFTWVGGWGEAVSVLSLRRDIAPVTKLLDARNTEVILGAIGKSSHPYLVPAMINNTLNTKFKIITGYRGGAPIRLAVEKGEVQGWSGQWEGWKIGKPDWVRDNKLVHLVQLASKPAPDLKDVPLLTSFATNPEQKKMFGIVQSGVSDRAMAVAPGVPADRVAAIRDAFHKTLRDPDFIKDAAKLKFDIDPIPGEDIQKFVTDVMASTKDEVAKMKAAMGLD